MYRTMGLTHAGFARIGQRLRAQAGQGTVEYVALILLVEKREKGQAVS